MKLCLSCYRSFDLPDWRCPACGHRPDTGPTGVIFAKPPGSSGATFRPEHFADVERVESTSFWFQGRGQLILWALDTYFPSARSFLDVGCGTGSVLASIQRTHPNIVLAGLELYAEGLGIARKKLGDVPLYQADLCNLPFTSEFDAIGAFDVLEHITEDEKAMAEVFRAVRPGGGFIVTVPQHPALWSPIDDYSRHRRRYTRIEMLAKLKRAGFEVARCTSFVTVLLPVMHLSRQWNRGAVDPHAEFRLPRIFNWCFSRLLDVERFLIRCGGSLPVGGSLLVVTRRAR